MSDHVAYCTRSYEWFKYSYDGTQLIWLEGMPSWAVFADGRNLKVETVVVHHGHTHILADRWTFTKNN